jgi:hypothetical protein
MPTPNEPKRHRLPEQKPALYLNESELPFSMPRVLPVVDVDAAAARAAALIAKKQRRAELPPA